MMAVPPPREAAALELRRISVRFPQQGQGPVVIAEDLDLTLPPGGFHCFVGRSGSGKTTLLRVASAMLVPDSGDVLWDGASTQRMGADELARARRDHMGYVDQGASCIDELRVLDNVLLPAVPRRGGISADLVDSAMELLKGLSMAQHAMAPAGRLSTGERQRVAIARALLLRPSVVCLDEPTASLDRANADHVVSALVDLAQGGVAVLAASHDHELVDAASTATFMD